MTDPQKPQPDEVEDLLLSALYHQGAKEEPSPEMDNAIREQARKVARRRRWFALPRLAVTMVLLLGVGVALRVFDLAPPERAVVEFEMPEDQEAAIPRPAPSTANGARSDEVTLEQLPTQPALQSAAPQVRKKSARESLEQRMFERANRQPGESSEPVCVGDVPPADAGPSEWLRRIRDLRQAGEQARAACLQDLYRERFSEADQIKPQTIRQ